MATWIKSAKTNWRTSLAGVLAALAAIIDGALKLLDSDSATNPDWTLIAALIVTAIGLIRARDDVVTTSDLRQEGVLP